MTYNVPGTAEFALDLLDVQRQIAGAKTPSSIGPAQCPARLGGGDFASGEASSMSDQLWARAMLAHMNNVAMTAAEAISLLLFSILSKPL
jgi:hypothetical protein